MIKFKKLIYFIFLIIILHSAFSIFNLRFAYAQNVLYPVPELGNCSSERECELYCEIPKNTPVCWSYGKYVMNQSEDVLGETTTAQFTFPIAQLGNCASADACFAYCNQPQNQVACLNFAKSKGLVKENPQDPKIQEAIEAAKTELGCDSKDACMTLCSQPANFDKCRTFGEKYNLTENKPPENRPLKQEVIDAAKTELGCDGQDTCAAFCQKAENREKCSSFAQKYNLGPPPSKPTSGQSVMSSPISGVPNQPMPSGFKKGPGDCGSEEECRKYCEKHPNECPGFNQKPPLTPGVLNKNITPAVKQQPTNEKGQFLGPSGCKTEAECKAYCEKHPKECPGFPQAQVTPQTPMMMPAGIGNQQPTLPPDFKIPPTLPPQGTQ